MPINQKIAPSSLSINSSSDAAEMNVEAPEVIKLHNFKLKSVGSGATRNTLVENDSLSSYSWPEETFRNGTSGQSGE